MSAILYKIENDIIEEVLVDATEVSLLLTQGYSATKEIPIKKPKAKPVKEKE